MQKRLGIIGIIIKDRNKMAVTVNTILSDHGDMIVGRMGLPFKERGVNIIDLIIEATTDEVGALTGKLGMLEGVQVKSLLV
ncbi:MULTISPECIES: TM1266 family iron-only hydrogenase system putative regulator [unclassified Pseudodesulfovibrio]|uniref:TM1266 family iron-only hydrogenase system putative regulator n=1 Tax=unclassified Pseudodesulfovibrio TaxID=2661612 RepID=UPI000FEBA50C|nr:MULTISPECIES: TM1266 family iron-only hydrogenase system putative regulator [unclassified Pseudodesulfovibrio]MCJ2164379.1 iron-only hydrogenase system regulator [Pseudodesulfovibrio sp. S3-i]RWU04587.1 CopG family transcriptional regulator [Pseudodesulfovibrio sp. S3]